MNFKHFWGTPKRADHLPKTFSRADLTLSLHPPDGNGVAHRVTHRGPGQGQEGTWSATSRGYGCCDHPQQVLRAQAHRVTHRGLPDQALGRARRGRGQPPPRATAAVTTNRQASTAHTWGPQEAERPFCSHGNESELDPNPISATFRLCGLGCPPLEPWPSLLAPASPRHRPQAVTAERHADGDSQDSLR